MSTVERAAPPGDTPWLAPFNRFHDQIEELTTVMELFVAGCRDVQTSAKLLDILDDVKDLLSRPLTDPALAKAQHDLAELALDQEHRGYPLLYEHSLLSLWGALEVLVEDLAVVWLEHHPDRLQAPPVSDVKLTVGDFERLSVDERLRHIVFEVQRGTKADLKQGVGQFKALLSAVGIDYAPPSVIRDALFYHHQLRNLVAHRGGVADRRFVDACPKLGYQIGETVSITDEHYGHLAISALHYSWGLRNHCAELDEYDPRWNDLGPVEVFDWATVRHQTQPEP